MDKQAGQLTRGGGYEEYLVAAGGGPTPGKDPIRVRVRKKLKIVPKIVLLFVYEILILLCSQFGPGWNLFELDGNDESP